MKHSLHQNNWHYLTGTQIINLFNEHFPDVEIQPSAVIVQQLQNLEAATLELLENRTSSSVYRIKQTGVVYQICQPDGAVFEFDDYEDYQNEKQIDELLVSYETKPAKFIIQEQNDEKKLVHLKPPRFIATIIKNNITNPLQNIIWLDDAPENAITLAKLMRKAAAFLKSYNK